MGEGKVPFGYKMKSNLITPGELAPDFELTDLHNDPIRLSGFRGEKVVVLAFLRGFL
jgi:peroxiredoxin